MFPLGLHGVRGIARTTFIHTPQSIRAATIRLRTPASVARRAVSGVALDGHSLRTLTVACTLLVLSTRALAQSNIDDTAPNKFAWTEHVGWTNWHDADGGAAGVVVGEFVMAGFIWSENIGWINVGDGAPAAPPHYANVDDSDFGVNITPDGTLHGLAWSENIGWINVDGGALAEPANPIVHARIDCDGRLNGYVWGENIGWINLSVLEAGKHVAVDAATTPIDCDMNHDGAVNGADVQRFVDFVRMTADPGWRDLCSGDIELFPDGTIDLDDLVVFVDCLLSA